MSNEEYESMTAELYSTENIVDSALAAGMKMADPKSVPREESREKSSFLVPPGFSLKEVDNHLERPTRKRGARTFISTKSFCTYVNKHKDDDQLVIIADEDKGQIKAILNDHGRETANWGDHTALLDLGFSKQWKTWSDHSSGNGKSFSQGAFADFLEDNRTDFMVGTIPGESGKDVKNISALELSAVITNLQMTSQEKFSSKIDPVSGRMTMSYENEETGKGNIEIPRQFILAIPVYRSADVFQVTIRLRHRIRDGAATFYYIIDQEELLKEAAFDKICMRIEKGNIGSESKEELQFSGVSIEVLKGVI